MKSDEILVRRIVSEINAELSTSIDYAMNTTSSLINYI